MQVAKKQVNLFVLGAPKCGTTSLVYYLKQHPSIFASDVKEPHFFNTDSKHRYYHSIEEYENLFDKAPEEAKYLLEGSVWYLYSNSAVKNILEYNPESKFIVMLRNPVDMYFSLHRELLYGGSENIKSPVTAWYAQQDRLSGTKIPKGAYEPSLLYYEDVCSLGTQLKRCMELIPEKNLMYIFLDDLKNNPEAVYQEVLNFLQLDGYSLESYDTINAKKQRKSQLLHNFVVYVNYIKKKLGIKFGMGLSRSINKGNVTDETADISEEINTLKPVLKSHFADDITLLESLTNRDLNKWKSE